MRLLQFAIPNCDEFYMRFSLYQPLSNKSHPILVMCNSKSKVFFWDFSRLEEYHNYTESLKETNQNDIGPPIPHWLLHSRHRKKDKRFDERGIRELSVADSIASSSHTMSTETVVGNGIEIAAIAKKKYAMDNPLEMLQAHKIEVVQGNRYMIGRQVAWSMSGEWCVVVGSPNVIALFKRYRS